MTDDEATPHLAPVDALEAHPATAAPPTPENTPQGLDDAALGGPDAWAAVVDVLQGHGPTPPASVSQTALHCVVADLEVLGVQTRPAASGGWFCWSESGTAFCRELADLRAVARRAKHDAKVAGQRESHAASMEHSLGRLTPSGKASPRWDRAAKPLKADRPAVDRKTWRDDFMDALARVLARTTANQKDVGEA